MAEVTPTDRANAASLWGWCMDHEGQRSTIELIAAALAEEREKTRAPFLALAEEYERHAGLMQAATDSGALPDVVMRSQAFRDTAASIRRAAEEGAER